MGKPSPGFDLAVIDHDGNVLGPNQEGDTAVRVRPEQPLGLFREYWRNPEAMSRSFTGDWYLTGDPAYRDADGYFWIVGRADDVIISAGYRIGPFEVESALVEHAAVVEAAVVASPDATRGEIVKAFVILAPGYTAGEVLAVELQEYVKSVTIPLSGCTSDQQPQRVADWRAWTAALGTQGGPALVIEFRDLLVG
jgi:acetyl-CoA synthetase/medium-chain acyl-CoA synthetase